MEGDALRPHVPRGLELETRDGSAWLGVVPFLMADVARRPLPPLPGAATFPELNLRTYVTRGGKPGVWFFSLDAASRLAVWAARALFDLPYAYATMSIERAGDGWAYRSTRRGSTPGSSTGPTFVARYGPSGPPYRAEPGSLEHWLTERYCAYALDRRGRIRRAEVHHAPWPLQPAWLDAERNEIAEPLGLRLNRPPEWVHYAERLDVVIWDLEVA